MELQNTSMIQDGKIMNTVCAIQTRGQYSEDEIRRCYHELISNYNYLRDIICKGDRVLIKPNIVAPSIKATTDLILLSCVIDTILEIGATPIVAESSGFEFSTAETFRILKLDVICQKKGVRLVNLDEEEFIEVESGNLFVPQYVLPKLIFEVDKIINIPRLKGHSLTKVTFSIKNLFGLLHRSTRRKIHATNLEMGIRYLKYLIPVNFVLVDGLWNLSNAVYSNADYRGILLCGDDMTSVDICCCKIYGVDYRKIPHIYNKDEDVEYACKELSAIQEFKRVERDEAWYQKQNIKYKTMYKIDLFVSKLFKRTIIPYVHYYGGIRPYIDKKKCKACGKCEKVCPVQAIQNKRISIERCVNVRCMKCYEACPNKAVVMKGFHKS